jgi:hypothetical protein
MRATAGMAGCSFNTVSKLLLDVGGVCTEFQDRTLRDLPLHDDPSRRDLVLCRVEGEERPRRPQGRVRRATDYAVFGPSAHHWRRLASEPTQQRAVSAPFAPT